MPTFIKSGSALFLLIVLISCNSNYTPKRRGYFKVDFPAHQYQSFDKPEFPYSFEYPAYANIVRDSTYFDSAAENPYWINVDFPDFGARIYISYKEIGSPSQFEKLRNDAYKMTYKHALKAGSIEDSLMKRTPNGISGVYFHVAGNAATSQQFFVTDTTRHFLRGALYFDAPPNEDSLAHVTNFLLKDIDHLINTFKWKTPSK